MKIIPFNKPYFTGNETIYINEVISNSRVSGNGKFTKLCQNYFENRYGFKKCLLTTSCTDALEMAAILCEIKLGDEVIAPNYTFVSTVNPFILRGAKIVFADSRIDHPGINESSIEALITKKTKVIIVVHYAGVACDMDLIMKIAKKYNLIVVEDAAQAIDSFYRDSYGNIKPLGSIGHLATFSFHETKNIISGEGGLLVINDSKFSERSEIIWEKGTNRSAFFKGEVDKYGWVDIGSSFLPSEIIAAFLWAQLEKIKEIQDKRIQNWNSYYVNLNEWASYNSIKLPVIPNYSSNNGHMFYMIMPSLLERDKFIFKLKQKNIQVVFHYQSLNKSLYYKNNNNLILDLQQSDFYSDCLVRLPLYYELDIDYILDCILDI